MSDPRWDDYDFMDVDDRAGEHIFVPEEFAEEQWPDGRARYKLHGTLETCNGLGINITFGDLATKDEYEAAGTGQKRGMALNKNLQKSLHRHYGITIDDMKKSGAPKGVKIGIETYIDKGGYAKVNMIKPIADVSKNSGAEETASAGTGF